MASSKEQLAALFKQLADEENKDLDAEVVEARRVDNEFTRRIAEEREKGVALTKSLAKVRAEKATAVAEMQAFEREQEISNKTLRASQEYVKAVMQLTAKYRESI